MKAEKKSKDAEQRMKEEAKKAVKGNTVMSGKALFKYDPTLFQDDEQAADEKFYEEIIDEVDEKHEEEKTQKNIYGKDDDNEENGDGVTSINTY